MSQKVKILSAKVKGAPYVGVVDGEDGPVDAWTTDPDEAMRWLWDGYRTRFNDRRALRKKSIYQPNPEFDPKKRKSPTNPVNLPVFDDAGERVLVPISATPGMELKKPEFRLLFPHARAIPDLMLHHAERTENTEWFAAAKRRKTSGGALPYFRSRKREDIRFGILVGGPNRNSPQAQFLRTGRRTGIVTIGGMNPSGKNAVGHKSRWQIQIRVRYTQPINTYTSVTINWTKKELVFVSPPKDRSRPATGAIVGLDVGVHRTIATSDGQFFDQPQTGDLDKRIKKLQRSLSRKRRINNPTGAKGWTPTAAYKTTRTQLGQAHSDKANRLNDWRHKTTTALVATYDVIGYEALQVKNMTKSAKGTTDKPGKNVAAKAGLNRSLANSAFTTLRSMIEYKAKAAGIIAVPVPPHYTSQECSQCKNPPRKDNRESQAIFSCKDCGFTTNADVNAANNIADRALIHYLEQLTGQDKAPAGNIGHKTDPAPAVGHFGDPSTPSLKTTGDLCEA